MSQGLSSPAKVPLRDRYDRLVPARCFLQALILFNGGISKVKCVVKSLSAREARLEVSAAWYLPNEFDLFLVQKEETLHGVQISRDGDMVEMALQKACDPSLDHRRALEDLVAENANLRNTTRLMADRLMALGKTVDVTEPPSHSVVPNIFSPG